MDLNWLTTFITAVRSGSFAAAAAELSYARSTVTHQIRCLERDLGVELFDRSTAGQPLTEAGRLFVQHARAVTERVSAARASLLRTVQCDPSVRLGVMDATRSYWLSQFMRSVESVLPETRFHVEIAAAEHLGARLSRGDLDMILEVVRAGGGAVAGSRRLWSERAVFAFPGTARTGTDAPRRIVTSPPGCPYREMLDEEYLRYHPDVRTVEVGSVEGVRACILAGLGAGVVPYRLVRSDLENGALRHRHWARLDGVTDVRVTWNPATADGPLGELLSRIVPCGR